MPRQPVGPIVPWAPSNSIAGGLRERVVLLYTAEGHKTVRERPKEGCRDGEGSGGKAYEQLETLGLLSPEKRPKADVTAACGDIQWFCDSPLIKYLCSPFPPGLPALPVPSNLMGIYNGEEFVFEESSWYIINVLKLLWHYGFSPLRMNMWVEDILDKFMR